jgi:DNA processing protein
MAALTALAGLPYMSWDRLRRLVQDRSAVHAWHGYAHGGGAGGGGGAPRSLASAAAATIAAGVAVRRLGTDVYPAVLAADHQAPEVLFTRGSIDALEPGRFRVAIVGTRRSTGYGRGVARRLGRELSEAGVHVVSGLALGIDGAAHDGALAGGGAAPIGVVGSGLDVVYPRRHAGLWERVGQAGALLSEAPVGCRPEPWRFPARNRIIAALADVLVVVESHERGGSMHTVRAAEERGVPILAVPGAVFSEASKGTNQLLSQGCHPACDVQDVLTALSLRHASAPVRPTLTLVDARPPPPGEFAAVLQLVDWSPTSLDTIVARADAPPAQVSMALAWLEREGWARGDGGWWERC